MNNLQALSQSNLIKEGDIFQIGQHILGCGKAEDGSLIGENCCEEEKLSIIVSDPPYSLQFC
jgi:hypothetical protein